MKIIEQLELKMESVKGRRTDAHECHEMLTDSRWWFEQIKKAVDSAPEPKKQGADSRVKPCFSRYRVVW